MNAMFIGPKESIPAPPSLMATLSQGLPVGLQAPSAVQLLLCEIIIEIYLLLSEAAALAKQEVLDLPILKPQMPEAVPSALGSDRSKSRVVQLHGG